MQIKIFIINLKRSADRRTHIENLFKQTPLSYEFFEGVDGNEINFESLETCFSVKMSKGEYGAALSHINIYKKIVEEKIPYALILEDDIEFDSRFEKFLLLFQKDSGANPYELILLSYHLDNVNFFKKGALSFWGRKVISPVFCIGKPVKWYWSAMAYLISYNGAVKLANNCNTPKMPADFLTASSPNYGVVLGILNNPIVWPSKLNDYSTIGERGTIEIYETENVNNKPPDIKPISMPMRSKKILVDFLRLKKSEVLLACDSFTKKAKRKSYAYLK